MPVDPRICCAAEVCCDPVGARLARLSLLKETGLSQEDVERVERWMTGAGLVLLPASLAAPLHGLLEAHLSGASDLSTLPWVSHDGEGREGQETGHSAEAGADHSPVKGAPIAPGRKGPHHAPGHGHREE